MYKSAMEANDWRTSHCVPMQEYEAIEKSKKKVYLHLRGLGLLCFLRCAMLMMVILKKNVNCFLSHN